MSAVGQRPEHLVIREYLHGLQAAKKITKESLRDAFVSQYLEMIPPGEDTPTFEAVHRHDSTEQMRRKDDANLKKLWRAIDGSTFFPLCFKAPLVAALEQLEKGMGINLQKVLLHNAGLYHLPIDVSGKAPLIYSELLIEFAEANQAMVEDMADDGMLNNARTREQLLDSLDKHLQALRELDKNTKQ